jgi:aldehyde:ferredoxin oxidoreductase
MQYLIVQLANYKRGIQKLPRTHDMHLQEKTGYDPKGKSAEEKIVALRKYREAEYERLKDTVYQRRGCNKNGVPMLEKVNALGIDYPDVVELLKKH